MREKIAAKPEKMTLQTFSFKREIASLENEGAKKVRTEFETGKRLSHPEMQSQIAQS